MDGSRRVPFGWTQGGGIPDGEREVYGVVLCNTPRGQGILIRPVLHYAVFCIQPAQPESDYQRGFASMDVMSWIQVLTDLLISPTSPQVLFNVVDVDALSPPGLC